MPVPSLSASLSLLQLLKFVKVTRYLRTEADSGTGAPWNRGHDLSGPVHDDGLIGRFRRLPIQAHLYVDAGFRDRGKHAVPIVVEYKNRHQKLAVTYP
jgi:hypothetical protein